MRTVATVSEKSYRRNDNSAEADFSALGAEWGAAWLAMTAADIRDLEKFGVTSRCAKYGLVGISRVSRIPDTELYEPDPTGLYQYITPARVDKPMSPQSSSPWLYARSGEIVDLVAWDPRIPDQWSLRLGLADWLGSVPPQHLDSEPVRILRSPLTWLRADCTGLVVLSPDQAIAYQLLMEFHGGICAEDQAHRSELRRLLRRPWPLPKISVWSSVGEPIYAAR
jgi:hypothetical protein